MLLGGPKLRSARLGEARRGLRRPERAKGPEDLLQTKPRKDAQKIEEMRKKDL